MTSDSELLDRLYTLTRGDLENAGFPLPDPSAVCADTESIRIRRLSEFWRTGDGVNQALLHHTAALLSGFHAQESHCLYVLRGSGRSIEYWIGAQKGQYTKMSLGSIVRGVLPDARIDDTAMLNPGSRYLYGSVLAGVPAARMADEHLLDQIETVIRALLGHEWLFFIRAEPRRSAAVVQDLNRLAHEIRDVRARLLLEASPDRGGNRIAQRYVDLLEAKLKRYEIGRTTGMWNVHAAFLADTPITLSIGRGLLQSAFSSDSDGGEILRACRCLPSAVTPRAVEALTTNEVAILARPPFEEYPGYELVEHARYGVEESGAAGDIIVLGDVIDRGVETGHALSIPSADLTKHVLITGITGSGKSTSCMALLRQVWSAGRGVPFLVIESAKSEYRNLLRDPSLEDLHVYTVADETIAPLRLNPFEVPKGVLVQTHIDYVKSLFSAAFVLYPPMPYVLEQSIQELYEDRGWDLARNRNRRGSSPRAFPRLADLASKIGDVVDRMGYDTRITMDVKAGLLARVNQLRLGGGKGLMLDCRSSTPAANLFERPCVLELKSLVSDDEKAFVIGLLLIRLHQHCEVSRRSAQGIRHVTVIEEAHRLLRNTSIEQGVDTMNPRGRAIEVFTNILSEIRAYGEGIVIAEQIASKLTPDAIKNTATKIVHRLLAEDDRRLLGASMNLDERQVRSLARLGTGEAVAFSERLQKPVLVRTRRDFASTVEVADHAVAAHMAARIRNTSDCVFCSRSNAVCRTRNIDLSDAKVSRSFRRFVNALRFAPIEAGRYLDDVRRTLRVRNPGADAPCALAILAEEECERRGAAAGWSFEQVEAALAALLDDCSAIDTNRLPRKFAGVAVSLYRSDSGPYAGCTACGRVCVLRFDASGAASSAAREFEHAFMNARESFGDLANISIAAVGAVMPAEVDDVRRDTALCWSVMQLDRLDLLGPNQSAIATRIAGELARTGAKR